MNFLRKIAFNSPVILVFVIICFGALILNTVTGGIANRLFFSVYRSSFFDPLTYIRMIGHVFGHANWYHFYGNITMLLLVGPLLEEKYGSWNIAIIMLITGIITGFINILIFPTGLLGASGIVFALILLSSITSKGDGKIPLTFIIVAIVYIGGQVYEGIFIDDNVSNLTHIVGGILGASFGHFMNKNKVKNA